MDPMKRMFLVGLTVPFAAAGMVALVLRPDSLLQWLLVAGVVPAASAVVAMVYAFRSRGPVAPPPRRARVRMDNTEARFTPKRPLKPHYPDSEGQA